jgi:hypothetical protein
MSFPQTTPSAISRQLLALAGADGTLLPPAKDALIHQVLVQFQDPGERAGGTLVPKTEFIVL